MIEQAASEFLFLMYKIPKLLLIKRKKKIKNTFLTYVNQALKYEKILLWKDFLNIPFSKMDNYLVNSLFF